jgi:hypothetical protein
MVDEAKWYQSDTNGHGTWKWQGSNDNSVWTDVGGHFYSAWISIPIEANYEL